MLPKSLNNDSLGAGASGESRNFNRRKAGIISGEPLQYLKSVSEKYNDYLESTPSRPREPSSSELTLGS